MKIETSRRSFLGAAGVAGLSAMGATPASAAIVPEPWGIKLGIATYSLRMFDRPTAIEMLKKFQVKYVSIKDVHLKIGAPPAETKAGRAEFDAAGLVVTSGGNVDMTKGTTVEDLRKQFEYAKAAGLPMMVCAPTHENIKAVETLVKEYNIRIAIHNHGPEDKHFPTPQSVLEVVRKLDKRCGLCMDIGHSARTGVDVVETIAGAGDRLFDMHVKDLADMKVKESQCDIGDGAMPFPAIFKQLKKMGYTGCVNMEYEVPVKDPTVGMLRSLSYMRGVLAALASAYVRMVNIPIGTKGEFQLLVTSEVAITFLEDEGARVLSTPNMIRFMEMTCRNAVLPLLDPGHDTVGTHVNVAHLGASPIGMLVTFTAEVIRVEGRRVEFRVEARDEKEKIGEGTHERAIINIAKFATRLAEKKR